MNATCQRCIGNNFHSYNTFEQLLQMVRSCRTAYDAVHVGNSVDDGGGASTGSSGGTVYSGHFMISSLQENDDDTNNDSSDSSSTDCKRSSAYSSRARGQPPPSNGRSGLSGSVGVTASVVDDRKQPPVDLRPSSKVRLAGVVCDASSSFAVPSGASSTCLVDSLHHHSAADGGYSAERSRPGSVNVGRQQGGKVEARSNSGYVNTRLGQERTMSCSGAAVVFIDGSLSKLLECMTLSYSGKLPSPKWKNFNGIKVRVKDKIRLNNIIWREWHRQFMFGLPSVVCQFDTPLHDRYHMRPEAVVLEGNYWKRRLESITSEYQKWRRFFIDHPVAGQPDKRLMDQVILQADMLDHVWNTQLTSLVTSQYLQASGASSEPSETCGGYQLANPELSFVDCIFSTVVQAPNNYSQAAETDSSYVTVSSGIADIIQPSLAQLQPTIEETMDTLEPLPAYYQTQPYRKMSTDVPATNNKRSILTAILTGRKTPNSRCTSASSPSFSVDITDVDFQQQQQTTRAAIGAADVPYTMTLPPNRTFRRKLGTGFVPSFSATVRCSQSPVETVAVSAAGAVCGDAVLQPDLVEVKPFSPYDASSNDSWYSSSPGYQSVESWSSRFPSMDTEMAPRAAPPASWPMGGVKGIRRLRALLDNNKKDVSRRASTGSLPPGMQTPADSAGFCVPQLKPVRTHQRHSVGGPHPPPVSLLGRHQPVSNDQGTVGPPMYPSMSSPALGAWGQQRQTDAMGQPPVDNKDFLRKIFTSEVGSVQMCQSPPHVLQQRKEQLVARQQQIDQRRALHISSEKKRRTNIKNEFERMEELISLMSGQQSEKCSKASVLHQASVMCSELAMGNERRASAIETIKQEIEELDFAIRTYCSQLPSTGVPVLQPKAAVMESLFDEYVQERSAFQWKFGVLSILLRPLYESYVSALPVVDSSSFVRKVDYWINEQCSLTCLRRTVSTQLMTLSKQTSILDDPSKFREDIETLAANRKQLNC